MITYEKLIKRPSAFVSLTGLSIGLFDALYQDYEKAHRARYAATTWKGEARRRAHGGGGPCRHGRKDHLLMALVWLRVYPTYEVLGFFFSLHKSNALRRVEDVLATLLGITSFSFERPGKERKALSSARAVMDLFPDVALVIDAKEQPIERPKGHDKQKPYYSGKKKRHTLKNQIGVTPDGKIGIVSDSVPGSTSDITLLRQSRALDALDEGEDAMTDKGYIGIRRDYPHLRILQPFKAGRGHPLTEQQEAANWLLSRYRIVVEHTNAQLNKFQALSQKFRKGRDKHPKVFRVVPGLVNRRIDVTPLKTYATV